MFAIAGGYEDLNDHQTMRHDPALQLAARVEPEEDQPLASPPTLCRLEGRVTRKALAAMQGVLVEQFIQAHPSPPQQIVLDFDATDDPNPRQAGGQVLPRLLRRVLLLPGVPLYVFCGEHLLCAYLRPSNIDPALHDIRGRAILKLLVKRIREAWPDTKIIFRGDPRSQMGASAAGG